MLAAAAAAAVWAAARSTPGASIVIEMPPPAVVPPPPVIAVIEQSPAPPPPPPPPPLPPPEPVAAVEPPVIGTRCPRDVSTIGVPIAQAPQPVGGSLRGAAAAPQGCALAAWTEAEIHVSWDSGQTFARFEAKGVIRLVAAAAERVAIVRDDGALGVVRRGEAPVWRALPKRAADGQQMQLYAAGAWIAVTLDRVGTELIAITDDDGATWRYLSPPDRALVAHLDPSGVLSARAITPTSEPDGEHIVEHVTQGFAASLRDPVWRRTRHTQGAVMLEVGPWSYTLEGDRFWGCGGSSKLVAAHGGRRATLLSEIRPEIWPFRVVTNGTATLAMFDQQLLRIEGAGTRQLVALPVDVDVGELVSVDGAGTAIARTDQRVLRWSERGGWRMLLDARAP